jgi:hypothetical protein
MKRKVKTQADQDFGYHKFLYSGKPGQTVYQCGEHIDCKHLIRIGPLFGKIVVEEARDTNHATEKGFSAPARGIHPSVKPIISANGTGAVITSALSVTANAQDRIAAAFPPGAQPSLRQVQNYIAARRRANRIDTTGTLRNFVNNNFIDSSRDPRYAALVDDDKPFVAYYEDVVQVIDGGLDTITQLCVFRTNRRGVSVLLRGHNAHSKGLTLHIDGAHGVLANNMVIIPSSITSIEIDAKGMPYHKAIFIGDTVSCGNLRILTKCFFLRKYTSFFSFFLQQIARTESAAVAAFTIRAFYKLAKDFTSIENFWFPPCDGR